VPEDAAAARMRNPIPPPPEPPPAADPEELRAPRKPRPREAPPTRCPGCGEAYRPNRAEWTTCLTCESDLAAEQAPPLPPEPESPPELPRFEDVAGTAARDEFVLGVLGEVTGARLVDDAGPLNPEGVEAWKARNGYPELEAWHRCHARLKDGRPCPSRRKAGSWYCGRHGEGDR
jgi:hypothetical protein